MEKEQVKTDFVNALHHANAHLSPNEVAKLIYEVYRGDSVLISNAIVMENIK